MANRATAAFVVSIVGAAYQMISVYVAGLFDRNTSLIYYSYGNETLFFTSFLVIWSASRILEDWKGRITWPSIIIVIGIANISAIIMAYYAQTSTIQIAPNVPSIGTIIALVTGPLLIILGGLLGLSAVKQYSREHGRAIIAHT
jgi:hypothetical protein